MILTTEQQKALLDKSKSKEENLMKLYSSDVFEELEMGKLIAFNRIKFDDLIK